MVVYFDHNFARQWDLLKFEQGFQFPPQLSSIDMNQETSRVLLPNWVSVKLPPPNQLIHSRLGALGDLDLAMTDRVGVLWVLTIGRGCKVHLGQQHLFVPDRLASGRQQGVGSTGPINLDLGGYLGRTTDDMVLRIVQMTIGLPIQRQGLTGLDRRGG